MNSFPALLGLGLKILLMFVSVFLLGMLLFASARDARAAAPKTTSIVTGEVFTAGDVFAGLDPEKAARVLGPSPQPGTDMVLNARTLMRVALALNLPWQPQSAADQVTIRRSATLVNEDVFTGIVNGALRDEGLSERFEISWSGSAPSVVLPQGQPQSAELTNFSYNARQDNFQATFAVPSKAMKLSELTVAGKVQRYTAVPVLKNSLRHGDLIGARDVMWIDLPVQDVQPDTLLRAEDLSGMTPRRMITAGKPVRDQDVHKPQLVSRGDFITLVYENGPIILTAKGKALQDGAEGDIVRIVNVSSNRSLEGIVTGDRQVSVAH